MEPCLLLLLQAWKEFEIRHGNEDTMREMLRIKRSVQATYNTQINMMSAQMLAEATNAEPPTPVVDSMKMLDTEAAQAPPSVNHLKFVIHASCKWTDFFPQAPKLPARTGSNIMFVRGETQPTSNQEAAANPDEIDIDDDDDDEEGEEVENNIEEQRVPRDVFGSLKKDEEEEPARGDHSANREEKESSPPPKKLKS